MKIVEYKNVVGNSLADLDGLVRAMLLSGWQPLGGTCYNSNRVCYFQAMVRYGEFNEQTKIEE